MALRGWIYVLVNESLPGLVKVGFSTKDPALRVKELSSTGIPREFEIAYEALVECPRELEQRVHARLRAQHENKEFFRIEPNDAMAAVQSVATEIGVELQLERANFPQPAGKSAEQETLPAITALPRRSITPYEIEAKGLFNSRHRRGVRATRVASTQPKRSCPHCGSDKLPSPSGYCQACFGVYRWGS
jgi:hypothetical protein